MVTSISVADALRCNNRREAANFFLEVKSPRSGDFFLPILKSKKKTLGQTMHYFPDYMNIVAFSDYYLVCACAINFVGKIMRINPYPCCLSAIHQVESEGY